MDAIVMLKADHKKVKGLFRKLRAHDLSVVPEICVELTVHGEIEEKVFYPAIRPEVESLDVDEAYEEHHVLKVLIDELEGMRQSDARYEAKAIVLMEIVEHHVTEEEEELFPDVREALGRNRLRELGTRMEELKDRIQARNAPAPKRRRAAQAA